MVNLYLNGQFVGMILASEAVIGREVCIGHRTYYVDFINSNIGYAYLAVKEEEV